MNPVRERLCGSGFVAREQAELRVVERDSTPLAPDEIAGRSLVTLISAGTESTGSYTSEGGHPRGSGYAGVFEVESVGEGVDDIKAGDHVFCMGNHRSYQRVKRDAALPLPEGLNTGDRCFRPIDEREPDDVDYDDRSTPGEGCHHRLGLLLVNLAAQNFTNAGYEVFACEPIESRRKVAIECGLKNVLSAVPVDVPDIAGTVGLVVDCSGHEQAVLDGCNVIPKEGRSGADRDAVASVYGDVCPYHPARDFPQICGLIVRSGWEWELPKSTDRVFARTAFTGISPPG